MGCFLSSEEEDAEAAVEKQKEKDVWKWTVTTSDYCLLPVLVKFYGLRSGSKISS